MTPYQPLWTPDEIRKTTLPLIPGVESRYPMRRWDEEPAPHSTPPRLKHGTPWTEDDDNTLVAMYQAGEHTMALCDAVGRSYYGVAQRLFDLRKCGRLGKRPPLKKKLHVVRSEAAPRMLIDIMPVRDILDLKAVETAWPPPPEEYTRIKITPLLGAVAAVCGVAIADMVSADRHKHFANARHIYFWMARHYAGRSFPEIGRRCGGRDHSTVMHGVAKIDAMKEKQPKHFAAVKETVRRVLARLESVA